MCPYRQVAGKWEEQGNSYMTDVQVKPTTGGYVRIGQLIAASILSNSEPQVRQQLESLLEVAVYLGQIGERNVPVRILAVSPDRAK